MNFSDETVDRLRLVFRENRKFRLGFESEGDADTRAMKAALQSLTLADLMGVDEVRAILEENKCLTCGK